MAIKHVSLVVPQGKCSLSTIACLVGAFEIFTRANDYWQHKGHEALLHIELAGHGETAVAHGHFSVTAHVNFTHIIKTDLIIIPSLAGNFDSVLQENQPLIKWIAEQYRGGAEVASMCTGAFMLASAGLLDGRHCATHWSAADTLKQVFPKIYLQPATLITDEKGVYTNGGAYSFLNLVIYLVEKYFDRETAIYCSKIFQVELDRHSQSEFIIFKGQKEHGDEIVKKAQNYLESNLESKISVDELCSVLAISRRNFDRRFIRATGNTPVEYAQRVKIEVAKKAFETSRKTINEVMYEVGYADDKAFRELFKKYTSMSPIEYKRKYNKDSTEI
jgi:transcriptional regulator GlxA family with amidase domain